MNINWSPEQCWQNKFAEFQNKIGYRFRNTKLFVEAVTHSTYSYEHSSYGLVCNERMEFLGDSVLGLTICKYLFTALPNQPEGKLSKLKSALVCEQTLVFVAEAWHLGDLLLLGKGEELSGGRLKPSNLADATEAVLGAIFLDSDFDTVAEITLNALNPFIKQAIAGSLVYDYKSLLLEKIQNKYHSSQLHFNLLNEQGPAHSPKFTIGIYLLDELLATAVGSSKKEAEQLAAKEALIVLDKKKCI